METEEKKSSKIEGKKKIKEVKTKKTPKKNEQDNKLLEENKTLNDKVLRLSAEMQNIKRRKEEEISKLCKYDGEKLIINLLNIVDNFERAIKIDDNNSGDELSKFLSGFKMIYTNLLNILNSYEVKEIDCLNKEFDPTLMEAVLTDKVEGIESNKVIEVLQKGYTYKDKVVRTAMVKVSE